MPWGSNIPAGSNKSDLVRRRLAYYIHMRMNRHGRRTELTKALNIGKDALRGSADYTFEVGDKRGGPSIDILVRVAEYFGDNVSVIMLAAERSTDEKVFDAMLLCDVHAQHRPELDFALSPQRGQMKAHPERDDNVMPMRQYA